MTISKDLQRQIELQVIVVSQQPTAVEFEKLEMLVDKWSCFHRIQEWDVKEYEEEEVITTVEAATSKEEFLESLGEPFPSDVGGISIEQKPKNYNELSEEKETNDEN